MSSPIHEMVVRLDSQLASARRPHTYIPPKAMRLPYKIALINMPPLAAVIAAFVLIMRGSNAPGYAFLGAAVLMVCWLKNVSGPNP